ncbi:MAG: DUF1841 family protein [Thiohalorhabdus sp.]|uniref:DUF1841 family protein n=1 Tax=Thiohalorhabdus sp. TaxID=3094134 RepID=UPI00397F5C75
MLFGNDRSETREVFFRSWEKFHKGEPLEPGEQLVIDVLHRHPEYHRVVGDRAGYADYEWTPESGETNPFLHMGMHIAIAEQVGTDRPQGIREAYQRLAAGMGDTHAAEHEIMECLGRALWEAQRSGTQPDEQGYLECVQRLARDKGGPAQ